MRIILTILLSFFFSSAAMAASINWAFSGSADNGNTLAGQFDYDFTTNVVSNASATFTPSQSTKDGVLSFLNFSLLDTYTESTIANQTPTLLVLSDGFSQPQDAEISLLFAANVLTNPVAFTGTAAFSIICPVSNCTTLNTSFGSTFANGVIVGSIQYTPTIAAVPLPAGALLLLSAMALLGLRRARRG